MNPQNLDPNVHPTKKEVKFLFELEIAREVEKWAFILLKDTGVVKRLNSTVEPINMKDNRTSINPNQERYVDQNILNINNSNLRKSSQQSSTPQANKQIRVDPKDQKLTKFWKAQHDKEKGLGDNNSTPIKNELFNAYIGSSEKKTKFDLRDSSDQKLLANDQNNIILELKDIDLIRDRLFDELKTLTDAKTTQFFRQLCFLSSISSNHMLAQHSQDLYLINTIPIMEELFKYEIIRTFGRSKNLELQNPIDLKELLNHFLLNSDKIPFARRKHHLSNLEVYLDDLNNLKDYLHKSIGLVISNNQIIALPNPYNLFTATDTLSQHDLAYTMLRIASQVNFSSVLASSSGLATEFANYLAWRLEMPFKQRQKQEKDIEKWNHFFEHTLLPTIKTKMALKKLDVQQFTAKVFSQEEAYKIFERC